jgi:hypothetical protein
VLQYRDGCLDSARAVGVIVLLPSMSRLAGNLVRVEVGTFVIGVDFLPAVALKAVAVAEVEIEILVEAAEVLLEAEMLFLVVQEAVVCMYSQADVEYRRL